MLTSTRWRSCPWAMSPNAKRAPGNPTAARRWNRRLRPRDPPVTEAAHGTARPILSCGPSPPQRFASDATEVALLTTFTPQVRIECGDALDLLRREPEASVNCVVTSPPYWGLRDYGVDGQIGLEHTPDEYVGRLVEVFAETRRVLRDDGVLWLNLGDSYATGAGAVGEHPGGGEQGKRWKGYRGTRGDSPKHAAGAMGPMTQPNRMPIAGLKPKDLIGIPWRVAFALQAEGWYLRCDVIWSKPNPMPESVTDRPTKAHEYLFLLSKSERYWYDADAIKEPAGTPRIAGRGNRADNDRDPVHGTRKQDALGKGTYTGFNDRWRERPTTDRNARSVWTIATQPYPDAHFATYPEELVRRCVLAGCPEGGIVLDPFSGSGTTLAVAARHGRHAVGFELNPAYVEMAKRRVWPEAQPRLALEVPS